MIQFWAQLLLSAVLVLTAAGDFLPPSTISSQQIGTCAIEEQREQAWEMIHQKTMSIIHDSVVPTVVILIFQPTHVMIFQKNTPRGGTG